MSCLRSLVFCSSMAQIAIGSYVSYLLLVRQPPDVIALLLCSALIITGLASLSGLVSAKRPSLSRISTVRMNLLMLCLIAAAAAVMITLEEKAGASAQRLDFLLLFFCLAGLPFLVNSIALLLIERRAKKLA